RFRGRPRRPQPSAGCRRAQSSVTRAAGANRGRPVDCPGATTDSPSRADRVVLPNSRVSIWKGVAPTPSSSYRPIIVLQAEARILHILLDLVLPHPDAT